MRKYGARLLEIAVDVVPLFLAAVLGLGMMVIALGFAFSTSPAFSDEPFSGVECTTHEYVNEVVSRCEVRINRDQMEGIAAMRRSIEQMDQRIQEDAEREAAAFKKAFPANPAP